jgi:hypothetical protein
MATRNQRHPVTSQPLVSGKGLGCQRRGRGPGVVQDAFASGKAEIARADECLDALAEDRLGREVWHFGHGMCLST